MIVNESKTVKGQGCMRGNVLHIQIGTLYNYIKKDIVMPEGVNPFEGREPDRKSLAGTQTGYYSLTLTEGSDDVDFTAYEASEGDMKVLEHAKSAAEGQSEDDSDESDEDTSDSDEEDDFFSDLDLDSEDESN